MSDIKDILYRAQRGDLYQKKPILDGVDDGLTGTKLGPADMELLSITDDTVRAIIEWLDTDDLDDDETMADRLYALFVGIFDANKNGLLDDDEQAVLTIILNTAWDYFTAHGVSEDDADALLNHWDAPTAERVFDWLAAELPDAGDKLDADIENFVWGDDQEPMLDSATKKRPSGDMFRQVLAIRDGKKVRINKRVAGTAKLSPKQKMAIRKMRAKSMSGAARMKRMKSMRMRRRMGLGGR